MPLKEPTEDTKKIFISSYIKGWHPQAKSSKLGGGLLYKDFHTLLNPPHPHPLPPRGCVIIIMMQRKDQVKKDVRIGIRKRERGII
jgi:hypothetical protein